MDSKKLDKKIQNSPLLQRVLEDISKANQTAEQTKIDTILNNKSIFKAIESYDKNNNRKAIAYIGKIGMSAIAPDDIAPIGSMLNAIGVVENLDLIIHSPGGSGPIAEKIVDMCRKHCTKEFRVIIPNMAKSAATLIALGADKIVMGYCSELGPIDAQKVISISGVTQQLSAQSFIDARNDLIKKLHEARKKKEEYIGYLQQLSSSTLEPAFIAECERELMFAKALVKKWLPQYMLKVKFPKMTQAQRKRKANTIAKNLSSANVRFVHGRMICPEEAQAIDLNIEILKKEDPFWNLLFELYVRAEVYLMVNSAENRQAKKLFMDANSQLMAF